MVKMPEQNNEQLVEMAQNGDSDAVSALVEKNLGLVWSIVRRFQNRGHDPEDLFQIGSIGLIKALRKFDSSYNVRFSTYAVPMILGEIKRHIRDDGMVKVSRSIKETSYRIKSAREELTRELGREPGIMEISEKLGISAEDLALASEAALPLGYLYECRPETGESQMMLIDSIGSNEGGDEAEMVDRITLRQALDTLDARERQIIVLRYFKEKTQVQIAKMLGLSQVQVSRIEKRILGNIRSRIELDADNR